VREGRRYKGNIHHVSSLWSDTLLGIGTRAELSRKCKERRMARGQEDTRRYGSSWLVTSGHKATAG